MAASVSVPSNDSIVGAGRGVTILDFTGATLAGQNGEFYGLYGFGGSSGNQNVAVRTLTLQDCHSGTHSCAALKTGWNWQVSTIGVKFSDIGFAGNQGTVCDDCYLHHNDVYGMTGNGTIQNSEVAFNGGTSDGGGSSGGSKFVQLVNVAWLNSYVHDNIGPAIWCDGCWKNSKVLIEGNRIEDNLGPGIDFEISWGAAGGSTGFGIARNNTLKGNAMDVLGKSCFWGAQISVQNSEGIEVTGNTIDSSVGTNALCATDTVRGDIYPTYPEHVTPFHATGNTFILRGAALVGEAGNQGGYTLNSSTFVVNSNTYLTDGANHWQFIDSGTVLSFAQWQAKGFDAASTAGCAQAIQGGSMTYEPVPALADALHNLLTDVATIPQLEETIKALTVKLVEAHAETDAAKQEIVGLNQLVTDLQQQLAACQATPVPVGAYVRNTTGDLLADVKVREQVFGPMSHVRIYLQLDKTSGASNQAPPLIAEGMVPVISYSANVAGKAVSFLSIARGDHDALLRADAADLAKIQGPLRVSWGQEGEARLNNPSNFPGGAGENSASDYKAAARRFLGFIENARTNPDMLVGQTLQSGGSALYMPEAKWVGLDVYNKWGALRDDGHYWGKTWETPETVILGDVKALQDRGYTGPIYLTELGCGPPTARVSTAGDPMLPAQPPDAQGNWYLHALEVARGAGVKVVLIFDVNKEANWQINATPRTAALWATRP